METKNKYGYPETLVEKYERESGRKSYQTKKPYDYPDRLDGKQTPQNSKINSQNKYGVSSQTYADSLAQKRQKEALEKEKAIKEAEEARRLKIQKEKDEENKRQQRLKEEAEMAAINDMMMNMF